MIFPMHDVLCSSLHLSSTTIFCKLLHQASADGNTTVAFFIYLPRVWLQRVSKSRFDLINDSISKFVQSKKIKLLFRWSKFKINMMVWKETFNVSSKLCGMKIFGVMSKLCLL